MNKPILFNTEMVRAIMDGRKTVTRRVIKVDFPDNWYRENDCRKHPYGAEVPCYISRKVGTEERGVIYPKYDVGDVLFVRETWHKSHDGYHYRADGEEISVSNLSGGIDFIEKNDGLKWRPSIHMPKESARLFLRVTDVRAERLQEISNKDALREGAARHGLYNEECYAGGCYNGDFESSCAKCEVPREGFSKLWNSTIKPADLDKYGWNANPWVWVISFERCEKPEGFDS